MWPGHQNNIGDQNIISVPQRPYNVTLPPPLLHTYTGLQIFIGPQQNSLFFGFSHIYRYRGLIYIWNIFFQNLQNLSFQKSIYVLGLSLTVKKLFDFEVMFRNIRSLFVFTSLQKSMSSHVCVNKKWLVRHVITPRTLLDAHGPKGVSESKQYDLTTHKNFFRASQSQRLDSLKSNFFESQSTLWK